MKQVLYYPDMGQTVSQTPAAAHAVEQEQLQADPGQPALRYDWASILDKQVLDNKLWRSAWWTCRVAVWLAHKWPLRQQAEQSAVQKMFGWTNGLCKILGNELLVLSLTFHPNMAVWSTPFLDWQCKV